MKKNHHFRFLALIAVGAFIFSGCTKDSLVNQDESQPVNSITGNKMPIGHFSTTRLIPLQASSGSLDVIILPEKAFASVILYSEDNFTTDEYFADENGYIHIDGLPASTYTMVIKSNSPAFLGQKVTEVKLNGEEPTDLGTIVLENNPGVVDYGKTK